MRREKQGRTYRFITFALSLALVRTGEACVRGGGERVAAFAMLAGARSLGRSEEVNSLCLCGSVARRPGWEVLIQSR